MYKYIHDFGTMKEVLQKFIEYVESEQNKRGTVDSGKVSFRTGYLAEHEQDKKRSAYVAGRIIGLERHGIAGRTIQALNTVKKDYKFMFVNWSHIDDYEKWIKKDSVTADRVLYELFTASDNSIEATFEQFISAFGHRYYDLMSTLLFIKDPEVYLPCRPNIMKNTFSNLGMDTSCFGEITFSRYCLFIDQIRDIHIFLTNNLESVNLIDAHSYAWMLSAYSEVSKYVFSTKEPGPDEKKREGTAIVNTRLKQSKFRLALEEYWNGKCALTGCELTEILLSSHIKPYRDCDTNREAYDVHNGFLFSPNVDRLFDYGYISFDDEGKIMISEKISKEDLEVLGLNAEMKLTKIEPKHREYLAYHRKNIFN